ncbi:MAG: S49 family peptidase [Gammaproteobacteria bacterium]|uniref:S49 family peptidase n=1 Tax=Rhodoferax sp. TaxID=50421 RepID=UPI0017FBFDB3|nr:S49 family peptidase [Rhodoferax sp.]MBU3899198.1 S49 family peptidase [Gammaproteobacteria bacterium]MBA3059133.1 S49 family peptidase [Rhodoferax sp.]MBU4019434.1 S49 family peptidase [Gammaproteobacteria bacterium]MBU4081998.1 S49 family peptidase [Gammaproteobacteria bacterium]MBU4114007.1 S49 family peptidase [Gammaproteobacteria bacterium]
MNLLPHLAARLFGAPLLIHRPKLDVILSVLGTRVGLPDLSAPTGFVQPDRSAAHADTGAARSSIAVIPIYGTLVRRTQGLEAQSGLTSYAGIAQSLETALADPSVAAILLDIDSPGGESSGVFDLADRIRAATTIKPVWAVANDMAFSAAYALGSAASRLIVSRTGGVGSIGVIAMHVDQSVKDQQDGIAYTAVFAGDRKNDLNPHAPISGEAHSFLQGEVNRIYDLFATTVAKHRHMGVNTIKSTQAALYFGADAVASGLADDVGTLDDAIRQINSMLTPPVPSLSRLLASQTLPETSPEKEIPMTQSVQPTPVLAQTGINTTTSAATAAATSPADSVFAVSDAIEVAQSCTLAGRTDLIAGFLEAKVAPSQVRSQLLTAMAQQSTEIVSRIDPNAAVRQEMATSNPASPDNPLIAAVKARIGAR